MKNLYIFLLISMMSAGVSAQMTCEPDPFYADSIGGVYPRPISEAFPNAGIDVPACPGQDYFFNFTVIVPDSILFGNTAIGVERVSLRGDNPVTGLPAGLSYVCSPANCSMDKNTRGCIALVGTVESGVTPGIYPLEILVTIVTSLGIPIQTQFPNEAIAPGEYFIVVGEPNEEGECLTVSLVETTSDQSLTMFPNPAKGEVQVLVPNRLMQQATLTVFDALGRPVISDKQLHVKDGQCQFSTAHLTSGTYIVTISDHQQRYQAKLVVQN